MTTGASLATDGTETNAAEKPHLNPDTLTLAPAASTFRKRLDRWLLGLAQATTQGGATAVKAFMGCAGANAILPGSVPVLNLKQTAAVFLVGAGYHFFDYLDKTPLVLPDDTTKN